MSTFHLVLGESLRLPRTLHLPFSVVEIYFNLLAVKACQFLQCSLISSSPLWCCYPLSRRCFAVVVQSGKFSAFSSEREQRSPSYSLSLYLSFLLSVVFSLRHIDSPTRLTSSLTFPCPLVSRELASNPTYGCYGNLFTSRILSRLYRRRLAPILLGFNDATRFNS